MKGVTSLSLGRGKIFRYFHFASQLLQEVSLSWLTPPGFVSELWQCRRFRPSSALHRFHSCSFYRPSSGTLDLNKSVDTLRGCDLVFESQFQFLYSLHLVSHSPDCFNFFAELFRAGEGEEHTALGACIARSEEFDFRPVFSLKHHQ